VNAGDQVRLASADGPELKLTEVPAEAPIVRAEALKDKAPDAPQAVSHADASTTDYNANFRGSKLDLKPGEEIPLMRGPAGQEHARLGMDEKGMYVIEGATSDGTHVNGQTLKPGEKVYLKPTDELLLGPLKKTAGGLESEQVNLMPREVLKLADSHVPSNPKEFQEAIDQSNAYAKRHEVSEPLKDGWSNGGQGREFGPDGKLLDLNARRPSTVVDRENDPVLRAVLEA
jgi:hypothetical protein